MKGKLSGVTVALFFALLFSGTVAFLLLPDRTFSEIENRSLTTFPRFSVHRLLSGDYADGMNSYFADQFPLREPLVSLKAMTQLWLGREENDGILLGRDGQLARRSFSVLRADGRVSALSDHFDASLLDASVEGILRANTSLSVPLTVCLTGRTIDVMADAFAYPDDYSRELLEHLRSSLASFDGYVDTVPMLRAYAKRGDAVYYKTDHHWTMLGAYYAYDALMHSWGMGKEILPVSAFQRESVSAELYGTSHAACGWQFIAPDTVELWHLGNESEFEIYADGRRLDGFYNRAYLRTRDVYSVYLDGVHEVVTVEKKGESRPRLVIFRDSFASSLVPFLAQHFDLVLLNLSSVRCDYTDLTRYATEYSADRVLVLYTLENVITTDTLARFR